MCFNTHIDIHNIDMNIHGYSSRNMHIPIDTHVQLSTEKIDNSLCGYLSKRMDIDVDIYERIFRPRATNLMVRKRISNLRPQDCSKRVDI